MKTHDGNALGQVGQVTRIAPTHGAADPRQQAFQRALAPQLGKALQGQVLARLGDGSFVVEVAEVAARMPLPAGAQVGADVPLTLVSLHPRPTFQVGAQSSPVFSEAGPPLPEDADPSKAPLAMRERAAAAPGARAERAAALLQASVAGAVTLPLGTEAQHTTLSRAGQAIGKVLAAAQQADTPMTAALGRTPVVGAPGADAASIATGLRQALAKSGLFYESHVAEWALGKRLRADLDLEPQQQAARAGLRQQPGDPATAQFISLQLATQEQAQVTWQGHLWPGQPMALEVQRDSREGHDEAQVRETSWHSRLRLDFRGLGALDAQLLLSAGTLQLRLATGSEDSAALLRRHLSSLIGALDAAGTPLAAFDARAATGPLPDSAGQ